MQPDREREGMVSTPESASKIIIPKIFKKRILISIDAEAYISDETIMREISLIQNKYPSSFKVNIITCMRK